jgi:hypothetical protein
VGYIIQVMASLAVNLATNVSAIQTKKYFYWVEQLEAVCETSEDFKIRKKKIFKHIKE